MRNIKTVILDLYPHRQNRTYTKIPSLTDHPECLLVSRDGERFQQTHFLPAALESWHWLHSWDLLIEIWLGSFLCYPWTGSWTSVQNKGRERARSTTVFWGRSWWKSSVGSRKPGWALELAAMGYPWTSNLISFRFSTYKLNIIFLTIENCDEK